MVTFVLARMVLTIFFFVKKKDRLTLRRKTIEELKKLGFYKEGKGKASLVFFVFVIFFLPDHEGRIAICSRSGDFLEPLPLPQW